MKNAIKIFLILTVTSGGAQQGANSVLLFPGIETLITPTTGAQQDGLQMPMKDQVERTRSFVNNHLGIVQNQVLVGHSQGGLRAMGYYHNTQLSAEERNRIKSIITIGSPILGFSPLSSGNISLRNKLTGILDTLLKGIPAVLLGEDFPAIPNNPNAGTTQRFFHFITSNPVVQLAIQDEKARSSLRSLARLPVVEMLGLDEAGLTATFPALTDLTPNSEFIRDATKVALIPEVLKVNPKYFTQYHTQRVLWWTITKDRNIKLGFVGSTFRELKNGQYIVYDLVTVLKPTPQAVLPSTTRIGHIVGTEASAVRMLGHSLGSDMATFETDFNKGLKAYQDTMWGMGAFHRSAGIINRSTFWFASLHPLFALTDPGRGIQFSIQLYQLSERQLRSADALFASHDMARDLVSKLNDDFYGSAQHDGFIPVSDQSLARNQGTSHMLGGSRGLIDKLGNARYEIQLPINHSVEKTDPEIWGPEGRIHTGHMTWGSLSKKIQKGTITEGGILFRSARAALGQDPPKDNPYLAEEAPGSDNHFIW